MVLQQVLVVLCTAAALLRSGLVVSQHVLVALRSWWLCALWGWLLPHWWFYATRPWLYVRGTTLVSGFTARSGGYTLVVLPVELMTLKTVTDPR